MMKIVQINKDEVLDHLCRGVIVYSFGGTTPKLCNLSKVSIGSLRFKLENCTDDLYVYFYLVHEE